MSRPIKFRVWDKRKKEWFPIKNTMCLILNTESTDLCFMTKQGPYPIPQTDQEDGGLNRYVLEQFTGLLDSEGKEIYEGDIVSVIYPEYQAAKVFCCPHSASFRLLSKNVALPMITMRTVEGQNAKLIPIFNEVLGNVHKNPELLAA